MKYIAYCRKSREEKDKQILSISAQIAELKEYAKREHLEISEFVEEEKTARIPGRGKFAEVLKKIESGHADGIIAWHPDRLARNSIDGGKIIYLLDTGKLLDLKFPTSWFENTPQGKFMLNIAFGQSKYYVDNLSENVKRGLRQKIRNGVWPHKPTYGYCNNPKTRGIDIDKEKAQGIKKAFEIFAEGNKTFTDISQYLYGCGLKNKNGKSLHINQIRKILSDKFYVGIMRYNGEYHDGKHETFIPKELFQKVQEELKRRDRHFGKSYNFPFLGFIRCQECGGAITAEQKTKFYKGTNRWAVYIYYRCTKKFGHCSQKAITAEEMESEIRHMIKRAALPSSWEKDWLQWLERDELLEKQNTGKMIEEMQKEIDAINQKQNFLLDSYLDQVIDSDTYKQKKNELFEKKLQLSEDLAKLKGNNFSRLEPFREFIFRALQAEKIARAKNTKEELAFFAKTVGSNFFLTDRRLSVSFNQGFDTLQLLRENQSQVSVPFADSRSVGEGRIELPIPHPQRGVLPLYYSPVI